MYSRQNVATAIVIMFAALVIVGLFNGMEFSVQAFQFEVRLELLDHGMTEISLPPLGSISARTHKTPVRIHITLESVDIDLLGKILEETAGKQQLITSVKTQMETILRNYIFRLLLLAFLGGMVGALLLRYSHPLAYLRAGAASVAIVTLLLVGTYSTYQIDRFSSPQFNGILKAAPWMVGLAEEALSRVQDLSGQMQVMASNLYTMFERIETLEPLGNIDGDLRILHVSDIHNNPAIFDLIKQIVDDFDVNFVIDTGDLSDFGTVLEGLLANELATLPVPYLFVPGNHDSPVTVEALQKHDNVIVLDGQAVELEGVTIFGIADPASYGFQLTSSIEEKYSGYTDSVKERLGIVEVDLIAVHRPNLARTLAGYAPVILYGHDHRQQIQKYKGSVLIDAGTTGAAGIRRLQVLNEVPHTLVLLHMNKANGRWVATAADVISLFEGTSRLSLERVLLVH